MVKAIVGANWGDEGKGKITDLLAETSDIVVRFQGGANAGHTIINDYGRFALHTLPSGVFYSHITNVIGNGVALDIRKLTDELTSLLDAGVPAPNLIISERAQLLMPYHALQDAYEEERRGGKAAPGVARVALLTRGKPRGGGEDGPDVGGQRQHAAEPQKGDGERAEHAAERQLMRFLCHVTGIRAPSRRGARW